MHSLSRCCMSEALGGVMMSFPSLPVDDAASCCLSLSFAVYRCCPFAITDDAVVVWCVSAGVRMCETVGVRLGRPPLVVLWRGFD